jgi:uncharacterized protein
MMDGNVVKLENGRLFLQVRVQPKSAVTRWGEVIGQEWIQLKINAPPVDGAANQACIRFIAKTLGTAKSNVLIIKGEKARNKRFRIESFDPDKLARFLADHHLAV